MDVDLCTIQEAKDRGALALFGEKYAEEVRVIDMGGVSTELCGGNTCGSNGRYWLFFKITMENVCSCLDPSH